MNILDCPIISTEVRLWRFWSYLLKRDAMRYVGTVPAGLMFVFMFAYLCRKTDSFEQLIINAFFVVLMFDMLLRPLTVIYKREKYEEFLTKIASVYMEIEANEDPVVRRMIQSFTRRARILSHANLILGYVVALFISIYPLFSGSRKMMFNLYIPGIDVSNSPQYEILCIIQAAWAIPSVGMYIPFSSFFISATLFGVVQMKTLQHQLATVKVSEKGKNLENFNSTVNKFIEEHLRIKDYVHDLNSLVTYVCFIEFISFGIFMCAMLFLLITSKNQSLLLFVVPYSIGIISQVFIFYWHANEVREESMKIAEAAYSGSWTDADCPVKKKILLISLNAQRPLEITLGNVFPMTLEIFQSLLNTTYSYYTVLRRFNN